jgi:RNA polymerase sigma-70 factor (ECF subfamily)
VIPTEARGAWRQLELRLRPYVARRVSSSADVDDVLQEVFARIHRGLGQLRSDGRFGAWVYRIAERAIIDNIRTRTRLMSRENASVESEDELIITTDEDAGLIPVMAEQCIAQFVARLASPYREAITLTELEGLTQKQAAELLGLSLSGMKSRVQRGREKIRVMFEECCDISLDRRGRVVRCAARPLDEVPEDCRIAAAAWALEHGTSAPSTMSGKLSTGLSRSASSASPAQSQNTHHRIPSKSSCARQS